MAILLTAKEMYETRCFNRECHSAGELSSSSRLRRAGRSNIPKIWNDAELSAMTLPSALPEGKIVYLPFGSLLQAKAIYRSSGAIRYITLIGNQGVISNGCSGRSRSLILTLAN
jgi:hypothetical protein